MIATIIVAAIIVGSLLPGASSSMPTLPPMLNNGIHVPAYALLTYCVLAAAAASRCPRRRIRIAGTIAAVSILAGSLELVQETVGRSASLVDMLLNALGIAIGSVAWIAGSHRLSNGRRPG